MMRPALPGWKVEVCGDDIAWMRFDSDGERPSDHTLALVRRFSSLLRMNFVSENLFLNNRPPPCLLAAPYPGDAEPFPSDLGSSSGRS